MNIEKFKWNCTNEEYHHSVVEDSHSTLDLFMRSVEEYAARRVFKTVQPMQPTEEMLFGSLFHTAILEPERLEVEYIKHEKFDRRTKKGKEGHTEYMERVGERRILVQDELDMVKAMERGISKNQLAFDLLTSPGYCEQAFRWIDKRTKHPLKMRADKILTNQKVILDLKTTKDVSPETWSKTVHNFGYHRQAALYLDGIRQMCGEEYRFIFLACSKTPPHECVAFELDFNALNLGRAQNNQILDELSERRRLNLWAGRWTNAIHKVSLPAYAFPRDN